MASMEDRQLVVLALRVLGIKLYVRIFGKRVTEIVIPIHVHRPDEHIVVVLVPRRGGVNFPEARLAALACPTPTGITSYEFVRDTGRVGGGDESSGSVVILLKNVLARVL